MKITSSQSGQGLVEAIIAAVVVILVMYSLVNLGILAMRSSDYAADRLRGEQYVSEGLEALRIMRDRTTDWSSLPFLTPGTYCFPPGDLSTAVPCGTPESLESGEFERVFLVSSVKRETKDDPPGTCTNGCSACGRIDAGAPADHEDGCTRKIEMVAAWQSSAESCPKYQAYLGVTKRYCVSASTYLTSWR